MLIGLGVFLIVLCIVVSIVVELFNLTFHLAVDLVKLGVAFIIIGAILEVILSILGRPTTWSWYRGRRR